MSSHTFQTCCNDRYSSILEWQNNLWYVIVFEQYFIIRNAELADKEKNEVKIWTYELRCYPAPDEEFTM